MGTLITVIILAVLVGFAIRSMVRQRKNGGSCSCGCSGCSNASNCRKTEGKE